ncbi:MAG: type II toxin-antitoxin system ParD family antitoxin [Alphaproteobacteria bacterium]|nr:type II toxin-antitoxin system ParD family antitoxin [Alphaproteobacteria bacterium]
MARQSISLSEPNHDWIARKIESKEFKSNSEVVNDALRKVRELESGTDALREALIIGERSGVSSRTPQEIVDAVLKQRYLDAGV